MPPLETDKTSLTCVGIVWQVAEYVNKEKKSYWSVDLLVKGQKGMLNVKLPENYDRSKLNEGSLVSIPVFFRSGKDFAFLSA